MTTQEGNKIIAKFMVNKVVGTEVYYSFCWDWLMEVVAEIEKRGLYQVIIKPYEVKIWSVNPIVGTKIITTHLIPPNEKIEAVWRACIDFINWRPEQLIAENVYSQNETKNITIPD